MMSMFENVGIYFNNDELENGHNINDHLFYPLVQFVQFTCEQIYVHKHRVINCQIFYKAEKTNVECAALVARVF